MKLWQTSTDTTLDCTVNDTLVDHGFKPTQVDPIDTGEGFCSQCERSCLNPAVCLHIIGFWRKIWGKPGKPESPYLAYRQGTWRQSFLQDLGLWQGCKQWLASRRHSRRQPVSQARLGNRTVGNFESLLAHTHTHIYIWYIYTYICLIYIYYVDTRCFAVIRKKSSFINNHVATLFLSLRYILAAGIVLLLFWNLQPLAGTCTAALPQVVLMASFICKPLRQSTHLL